MKGMDFGNNNEAKILLHTIGELGKVISKPYRVRP